MRSLDVRRAVAVGVAAAALASAAACSDLIGLGDTPIIVLAPVDAGGGVVVVQNAADSESGSGDVGAAPLPGQDAAPDAAPDTDAWIDAADGTVPEADTTMSTAIDAAADGDGGDASPASSVPDPPTSCLDIVTARPDAGSQVYRIVVDGVAVNAYCDMDLGGGGWTAFFANQAGNQFAAADFTTTPAGPVDSCPDPTASCLRHLPTSVGTGTDFAARCGDAAIRFRIPIGVLAYLQSGLSTGWQTLAFVTPLAGTVDTSQPYGFWTGLNDGSHNFGWIIDPPALPSGTFASSYSYSNGYDFCNAVPLQSLPFPPMVMLFYR